MAAPISAATEVPLFDGGSRVMTEEAAAPSGWPPAVAKRYKHAVMTGQGMFSKVYAAWDSAEEQLVAVKQLSGRTDDEFVVTGPCEFAQEVTALKACCGHPNVVKLLAAFTGDVDRSGNRFIVTEFAGPSNLRRYLQQRHRADRPLSEDEVRSAMAQLLSAVAHVHHAGVLHREVVPENVVVDDDDQQQMKKKKKKACKYTICGFNVSEQAKQPAKDGSTQLASPIQYRAPELFLGSSVIYDERIDTWGLGCIMAELIASTGVPFFGAAAGSDDAQGLKGVLQVVGGKGLAEWSARLQQDVVEIPQDASELLKDYRRDTGCLRAKFPKKKLSKAGFDVLSGLLESNPDRRLTATAALKMPWFRRHDHFVACFTSPVTRTSG